jgi:protein involved in polysaccharide export with SLBB domain
MTRILLFAAVALLALLTGCGGSLPPAQTMAAPAPSENDLLRVGDVLTIRLSGIPAEDAGIYEVKIGDEGEISMPYAGQFQASGKTTSQLKDEIEAAYRNKKIYSTPNITIVPQLRYVNINGEVRNPQRIPFTNDLSVLRAITACGGFTDYANKHRVKLLRGSKVIPFDAVAALKNPSLDIPLQAGDQIQIDRSIF